MQAARDHGLPYSQFEGVNRPGAAWTGRDRALAVALRLFEQTLCPGCGWPRGVSMDPMLRKQWRARVTGRCYSCTEIEQKRDGFTEDKGTRAPGALQFGAELEPPGVDYLNVVD